MKPIMIEIAKMTPQERRKVSLYDSIVGGALVLRSRLAMKQLQKRRIKNRIAGLSRRRNRHD